MYLLYHFFAKNNNKRENYLNDSMVLKIFISDEINLAFDHKSLQIGVTKL
jgi:hypothetical protein